MARSQDLEKEKGEQTSQVSYNPSTTEPPSTPRSSQPRYPISYETPDNKRKASETSLETRSALTTPNKLLQPEAKIQALQKDFIGVILNKVYGGHVGVHWAKGRHMHLSYHEYLRFHYAIADDSTSATSFEYTVRLNENETLKGRVKATADGALRPITNKPPETKPRFVWDKQKTVLSFEVFLISNTLIVGQKG